VDRHAGQAVKAKNGDWFGTMPCLYPFFGKAPGHCPANHYFTFSNAQKSEIVGDISQPLSAIELAQRPTPHFFTFSLFHARASSKRHNP
jgi:hypothetical protein